jgi:hypothetical protein
MVQPHEWRDMTKLAVAIGSVKSPKRINDNRQLSRLSHQLLTMQAESLRNAERKIHFQKKKRPRELPRLQVAVEDSKSYTENTNNENKDGPSKTLSAAYFYKTT